MTTPLPESPRHDLGPGSSMWEADIAEGRSPAAVGKDKAETVEREWLPLVFEEGVCRQKLDLGERDVSSADKLAVLGDMAAVPLASGPVDGMAAAALPMD